MGARVQAQDTIASGGDVRSAAPASTPVAVHRYRLDNIDALRAVAVIAVMLFHYTARFPLDYMRYDQPVWAASYGDMGVSLFFIISGYCISMTAVRCPGVTSFWARRFSRLQPAYVAAIVITFGVVAFYGLPGREISGLNAMANAIWFNLFDAAPNVDGAYWSLVVEIKLYFLFGILFFAMRRYGDPVLWWSLCCLAGGLIWVLDRRLAGGSVSHYTFSLATFAFPFCGLFLAGMLLYRWDVTRPWLKFLACAAFAVCCVNLARDWVELTVLLAMLPLLKLILARKSLSIPAPIVFIGFVSYPLYLIHQNVGVVVIRETAAAIPSAYGRIMLAVLVSVSIAAILSFAVEYRFRKRLEHLIEGLVGDLLGRPSRLRLAFAASRLSATSPPRIGD